MIKESTWKKVLTAVFVFCIFSTLAFSVYIRTPGMFSTDDPYYHAYRASEFWRGVPNQDIDIPKYSMLREKPVTFYLAYYWTMAPFTAGFDGTNYDALIMGSKVYHALLVGLLYVTFFLVADVVLKNSNYAFVATLCLSAFSNMFSFRSFLQRPHLISIMIVLIAYVYAVRNKLWGIFIINVISPFTYSTSFFSAVPGVVYGAFSKRWKPIIASLGGLILGILIRPDTFNYVFNGYALHLVSVFRSTILFQPGPGELTAGNPDWLRELWMPVMILVFTYGMLYMLKRKDKILTISSQEGYTLVLSFIFFFPFIFVQREIEYALPFAILSIFILWVHHTMPIIMSCKKKYEIPENTPTFARILLYTSRECVATLYEYRTVLVISFFLFILGSGIHNLSDKNAFADAQPSPQIFEDVGMYLKTHSHPGDLVFYRDFSLYNRLVFFDSVNQYPLGMDPIFTYAFDREKYWEWFHFQKEGRMCTDRTCTVATTHDVFNTLRDTFGARYVVIDYSLSPDGLKDNETVEGVLKADARFKLVYETPGSEARIYELVGSM